MPAEKSQTHAELEAAEVAYYSALEGAVEGPSDAKPKYTAGMQARHRAFATGRLRTESGIGGGPRPPTLASRQKARKAYLDAVEERAQVSAAERQKTILDIVLGAKPPAEPDLEISDEGVDAFAEVVSALGVDSATEEIAHALDRPIRGAPDAGETPEDQTSGA